MMNFLFTGAIAIWGLSGAACRLIIMNRRVTMMGDNPASAKKRTRSRLQAISDARPPVLPAPRVSKRDLTPRSIDRETTYRNGLVLMASGQKLDCVVKDISAAGARIAMSGNMALPPIVKLMVAQTGQAFTARVAWQDTSEAGLAFVS
jgi:hypothetical protein